MKKLSLLLFLCVGMIAWLGAQSLPWPAQSPNPDSYGYTWKTNSAADGPTFNWIDISGVGTEVTGVGDDGNAGPFQMGIEFPYYWLTRNEVWIGDNGFMAFSPNPIGSTAIGFPPTPTPDETDDLIAPFMADMNPTGAGNPNKIYYYTDTANNRFIVTWENMPFWVPPATNPNQWSGANTFQVILDASDSTITFQYLKQEGNWADSYNMAAHPFVVGIEAVTGTIGLRATTDPVTAAQKPVDSTAITFYSPKDPGDITDLGVTAVQNRENKGFFVPWEGPPASSPPAFRLGGEIGNLGNTDITADIAIRALAQDTSGQIFYLRRDTVKGGLLAGERAGFFFTLPFYPPFSGPYRYQLEIENAQSAGDINPNNDLGQAEAVVIDTTGSQVVLSFASNNPTNLNTANGGGIISWTGNNGDSGGGVFYDPFGYPLKIEALDFFVGFDPMTPTAGFLAQVYAVDTLTGQVPGTLLYSETVPGDSLIANNWTRVFLDSAITIESDGFYVSWIQLDNNIVLGTESAAPISKRSFEILNNNWSIWRTNASEEMWIRAVINIEEAIFTDVEEPIETLTQFEVYPNPTDGPVQVVVDLNQPTDLMVKLFDLQGRKVFVELRKDITQYREQLDLSGMSPGMYVLQILTKEGKQTRRILLR